MFDSGLLLQYPRPRRSTVSCSIPQSTLCRGLSVYLLELTTLFPAVLLSSVVLRFGPAFKYLDLNQYKGICFRKTQDVV